MDHNPQPRPIPYNTNADDPPSRTRPVPVKRPQGVELLAIWNILGGVSSLIGGIVFASTGDLFKYWFVPPLIVLSVVALVVGIGLWRLQSWARIAVIVQYGLYYVWYLFLAFSLRNSNSDLPARPMTGSDILFIVIPAVIAIAIPALVAFYMLRPNVRAAFNRRSI